MTSEPARLRVSARTFATIYWIGFLICCGLAVAAAARPLEENWSYWLLRISLGHMTVLVIAGFRSRTEDRATAGSKVGTMGYLYTLVGFTVALYQLAVTKTFSIRELLPPLATALITSIIGWFFGGEIAETERRDVSLESEAERVAAELNGFAHAIRAGHEEYLRIVADGGNQIAVASAQVTDFFGKVTRLQDDFFNRARATTAELFETILTNYKATEGSWKEVTELAKKNSDAASSAAAIIAGNFERVARAVDETRSHLEATTRKLTEHFGKDLAETMRELKVNAGSARDEMKELAAASRETVRYLNESEKLIIALERLLEAISDARPVAP